MKQPSVLCFLLLISACSNPAPPPGSAKTGQSSTDTLEWSDPTETMEGIVNGRPVHFSHRNGEVYLFLADGKALLGRLITEQGFGDDPDATVYTLNPEKPADQRKYFVRFTGDSAFMLDGSRKITGSKLEFTRR